MLLNTSSPRHRASLKKGTPLRKRIHLSDEVLGELVRILTQRIRTVPYESYKPYLRKALLLAPHEEDAPYLALALLLDLPIWSNDKGLKIQTRVKVYSTHELIEILENQPKNEKKTHK